MSVSLKLTELCRCNICKCSFNNNKGHAYSAKHVEKLRCIMSKFGKKIMDARLLLRGPVIKEGSNTEEGHSMFWCYFCSAEYAQHLAFDGQFYLYNAGILDHIASARHKLMTQKFWCNNRLKSSKSKLVNGHTTAAAAAAATAVKNSHEPKQSRTILEDYYSSRVQSRLHAEIGGPTCTWKDWLTRTSKQQAHSEVRQDNECVAKDQVGSCETEPVAMSRDKSVYANKQLFMLDIDEFHRYRELIKQSIEQHFISLDEKLKQTVQQIVSCEEKRRHQLTECQQAATTTRTALETLSAVVAGSIDTIIGSDTIIGPTMEHLEQHVVKLMSANCAQQVMPPVNNWRLAVSRGRRRNQRLHQQNRLKEYESECQSIYRHRQLSDSVSVIDSATYTDSLPSLHSNSASQSTTLHTKYQRKRSADSSSTNQHATSLLRLNIASNLL